MLAKKKTLIAALATVATFSLGAGAWHLFLQPKAGRAQAPEAVAASAASASGAEAQVLTPLLEQARALVQAQRKIIVLFADEAKAGPEVAERAKPVGQALFHENQARVLALEERLRSLIQGGEAQRLAVIAGLLDYMESDAQLFDADRLAFVEVLRSLKTDIAQDSTLPAIKLHKRISEDLDALAEIERNYDKEIQRIFGRFEGSRAIELKREKWEDYVAQLKKSLSREQILKDYGVVTPYPLPPTAKASASEEGENAEVFGKELPPKTIVLTFDDGPHRSYTEEITAILKQYGAPAVFFQVGSNLGRLDAQGKPQLGGLAKISQGLLDEGHAIGNHSLTHAQLSKRTGDALKQEILGTDSLLQAVDKRRSPIFRFPYGARNAEGMEILGQAKLRSVMWNIDSMDWADPVPSSIAERVLKTVEKEGRGIILFHDIHERTVKALPLILEKLSAQGYQFAGWDGAKFKSVKREAPPAAAVATPAYADSWAIVIGINDYAKWPKLQYAVRDAQAMRETLIQKFGFAPERVISLDNQDATRMGILGAFHDKLAHSGMKKNDRLLVFFAGHGATLQLSSGRSLGYIIPVDSDPGKIATDAIPMTELQNIAESLTAKHALFIMDACYSGLGLTRGGGSANFLRDNARRIGRQMLTAGGADQLVADGGPNGHSVFTWTLLQGLAGKGDLNGDGLITATELAAYVGPAVSAVSRQTPAFGSLPGSEGGDFVFELPANDEFISAQTSQLPSDAIALNGKLDAVAAPPQAAAGGDKPAQLPVSTTVVLKDLQGQDQKLVTPAAMPSSMRQLAQRANDRGLQHFKEKRYLEAEREFTEALKLRPDFALAANNLGFVFYKQDKFKEAARWFENAIQMDRSRAIAYLNLGDARARSGDAEGAKKAYSTYLALLPNGPGAAYAKQKLAGD
ncbi:peptidoglycan/xylan/chitin deacetylase (PgdA/CDA1 family)/TolA-binding protein [Paucibacter oligotrophus]|uniref:Peptidoglycan/xylan/chitin deacetylase (PgdA/CDA1 family)/TolA-binding protein n=1 Tax=Roseateles oligotrophus TaxID=1769250 RepID=A0A840LCM1_9BURK|nr:polysaccharide deacetylase family protein [Roseateles oligotrophus]MBB4843067.1 peptidoglycan/xylan/chitin deacetylase (PgdA/CDA1 family)/TolA-binding protein [Roseateles oligotrophus]